MYTDDSLWVHEDGYGDGKSVFGIIGGLVMLTVGLLQLVVSLFRGQRG